MCIENIERTERLFIEDLSVSHAKEMYAGLKDVRGYSFIPDDPPKSISFLEKRYKFLSSNKVSPDGKEKWLNWVIRNNNSVCVGYIQATVDICSERCLIGYHFFPDYWGLGYAKEALIWLCNYLLYGMGIRYIVALIDTRNIKSISLVEKIGFRKNSTIHEADFFKGSTSDEYEYILCRDI